MPGLWKAYENGGDGYLGLKMFQAREEELPKTRRIVRIKRKTRCYK